MFSFHAFTSSMIEGIFANSSSHLTGDEQFVQKAIVDSMRLFTLAVDNRWINRYAIYRYLDVNCPPSSTERTRQRGGNTREGDVSLFNVEGRRRKSGSPKKNQKRHRTSQDIEQIIDKYSAEHPLTVGDSVKAMARPMVLAKYGRNEISLDGQFAKSKELKGIEKCKRCQQRQIRCIKVAPDDFWSRRQCTECVQHHSSCTLAPKSNKIRKKRRYVAPLPSIHFIELCEESEAFLLRVRDDVLPHFPIQTDILLPT